MGGWDGGVGCTYDCVHGMRVCECAWDAKGATVRLWVCTPRTPLPARPDRSPRGRYQTARDMLLLSHLADSIHQFDISTQILYNRALVRCGICAFESELLLEAHSALMELAAGARLKELLAQGVSSARFNEVRPTLIRDGRP